METEPAAGWKQLEITMTRLNEMEMILSQIHLPNLALILRLNLLKPICCAVEHVITDPLKEE